MIRLYLFILDSIQSLKYLGICEEKVSHGHECTNNRYTNCLGIGTLQYGGKHCNSMFGKSEHFSATCIIPPGYHIL